MECRPYGSIHIRQTYLTQRIIKMIPGMDTSRAKPNPAVTPHLAKNEGYQARKMTLIKNQ